MVPQHSTQGLQKRGKEWDISEFPLPAEIISEESWKLSVVTLLHYTLMRTGTGSKTQLSQWILKIKKS
jgi:hypothetical protein